MTYASDIPATRTPMMRRQIDRGHIRITDVAVTFKAGGTVRTAVESTDVEIQPGEFVCLLGPSGCGKSTLLNCVAGHVNPSSGVVLVDGEKILKPGPDRGMVFQQYSLFPWKTVRENIAFGPQITGRGDGSPTSVANTFLDMIGLSKYGDSYPSELSGGMQQRVGIARALANYPSVLLMDEPFGALDSQTRLMMQENLLRLWQEFGITVLFVTHDVDEAVYLSDRILIMSASPGKIIADLRVDLPRPRTIEQTTTAGFAEMRKTCMEFIRAESLKAFKQQNA
jgi:NitT/TauT family transport system ATP-binding protein